MITEHFYDDILEILPISSDRGINIPFTYEEKDYLTLGYFEEEYREASFSTHTYQGVGGIHFYGSIRIDTTVKDLTDGYHVLRSWGNVFPKEAKDIRIDILRPLTQKEIDEESYRWDPQWYSAGTLVNAFYTEEELFQVVKNHLKDIFKGKWVLRCDLWNSQEKIIIDETETSIN